MISARAFPGTLPGFQGMVVRIFGTHTDMYYLPEEIIEIIREYVDRVEQSIENGEDPNIYVLDLFRWFICLCNQLGLSLRTALWNKYPGVCPYCAKLVCDGHGRLMLQPNRLQKLREKKGKPVTIRSWQRLFQCVYGKVNEERGLDFIITRVREEVSELAKFTEYPFARTDDSARELEAADVGAWIFGLAVFLKIELEPELSQRFPWSCPNCREKLCKCPGFDDRSRHGSRRE